MTVSTANIKYEINQMKLYVIVDSNTNGILQRQLNAVDYKVSSNLKYVLLMADIRKGFKYTKMARYYVYEVASR